MVFPPIGRDIDQVRIITHVVDSQVGHFAIPGKMFIHFPIQGTIESPECSIRLSILKVGKCAAHGQDGLGLGFEVDIVADVIEVPPYLDRQPIRCVLDTTDGTKGLFGNQGRIAFFVGRRAVHAGGYLLGQGLLPGLRGAEKLARTLQDQMADALLFRVIATTALDVPVGVVDDWRWQGPTPALAALAARLGAPDIAERAARMWERVSAR